MDPGETTEAGQSPSLISTPADFQKQLLKLLKPQLLDAHQHYSGQSDSVPGTLRL